MPFCTQCGVQVKETAKFCAACGAVQADVAPAGAGPEFSPRTASILCYVPMMGWIASVMVLASQRFRNDNGVRFHAFQGLYLFIAWLLLNGNWGLVDIIHFQGMRFRFNYGGVITMFFWGLWIFMMVKTSRNERFRLPLLGEWAERSLVR